MGLNENLNLALKILKDKNIPQDDPEFLKLKDFLTKNNSIGFLGYVTKMTLNSFNRIREASFVLAQDLINNRDLLKNLPKDISTYDRIEDFESDLLKVQNLRKVKKFTSKLTNKDLVNLLNQEDLHQNQIDNIEYFLKIDSSDQKEFLSKTDKYKDVVEFLKDLDEFVDNHKIGFNYSGVLKKINSMGKNDIKLLYSSDNKILCRIITYEASKEIGSTSWCIVGDENHFRDYTENGKNYQYFFFNFDPKIPPDLKMIAFTMDSENHITASHDRYDNYFKNPLSYLSSIGIKEKIIMINSRELFKTKINNIDVYNEEKIKIVYKKLETKEGKPYFHLENNRQINYLVRIILNLLNETKTNHLDLILEKFESYPTYYGDYYGGGYELRKYKDLNVFQYLINNYDTIYNEDIQLSKNKLIDILTKIYQSNLKIKEETTRSILFFLKQNNVDILKLSQQKKSKYNQDLGSTEFSMLAKRGENLKPIIQNKLSSIRRGEDVSMTDAEINYSIDNGYKDVIMKYYKDMLPDFGENQLSYEDLNIYKKLGLIGDVSKIIKSKGDMYGVDSLNSIEKSLYDYSK